MVVPRCISRYFLLSCLSHLITCSGQGDRKMQYLLVTFPEQRTVIIDDIEQGMTNELLELEAGTHTATLALPHDLAPDMREFILRRTSELNPKVIRFEKI